MSRSAPSTQAQRAATTVVLLAIVMVAAWLRQPRQGQFVDPASVRSAVNPNTAPWWELMILQGVGEARARDIVAFREGKARDPARPTLVFQTLADVEQVRGIGPAILRDISPELLLSQGGADRPARVPQAGWPKQLP